MITACFLCACVYVQICMWINLMVAAAHSQMLMNPFYEPGQDITSGEFRNKVRLLAKKYL